MGHIRKIPFNRDEEIFYRLKLDGETQKATLTELFKNYADQYIYVQLNAKDTLGNRRSIWFPTKVEMCLLMTIREAGDPEL